MLFNSYLFIFGFLPVTLAVFFFLRNRRPTIAKVWLVLASLTFYGYWNPIYLFLIGGSIVANYAISLWLHRTRRRLLLACGVGLNLATIGYFKYSVFFVGIVAGPQHVPDVLQMIVLPLAISFFTFQQIAYLVDVQRGEVTPSDLPTYALFVSFFPQLIAGPIVRFQQIAPQLAALGRERAGLPQTLAPGVILFILGLAKKVLVADTFAPFVNAVFGLPPENSVGPLDAWLGAYAYTFQLYFDFSGYSDMAIGLALMMGFRIPVNFFSPYKARNMIDFWRRWHITLSEFFRDYCYIPLGGNRTSGTHQAFNLLLVMLVVGLWHGAGWTFVLWGLNHGVLLTTTHVVRFYKGPIQTRLLNLFPWLSGSGRSSLGQWTMDAAGWFVTFHLVVIGWVLFRSPTLSVAGSLFRGLAFQTGTSNAFEDERYYLIVIPLILLALLVCTQFSNSIHSIQNLHKVVGTEKFSDSPADWWKDIRWKLSPVSALGLGTLAYLSLSTISNLSTEFLYFNF